MKLNILKARIKRNNLEGYARDYFIDENSEVIKALKNEKKKALIGIKKNDKIYTILGEEFVYYSTISGKKGQISLNIFSNLLHEEAMSKGKLLSRYKYLKIDNGEKIWLNNKSTMQALSNTILYLIDTQANASEIK